MRCLEFFDGLDVAENDLTVKWHVVRSHQLASLFDFRLLDKFLHARTHLWVTLEGLASFVVELSGNLQLFKDGERDTLTNLVHLLNLLATQLGEHLLILVVEEVSAAILVLVVNLLGQLDLQSENDAEDLDVLIYLEESAHVRGNVDIWCIYAQILHFAHVLLAKLERSL